MNKLPSGITFSSRDCVPINELRISLLSIARFLQDKSPHQPLIQYDDWWQHDGLHFEKKRIELSDLFAFLSTNRSLFESVPEDFDVRVGISDQEHQWYLRYIVDWNEEEKELEGNFHFSIPSDWSVEFMQIKFNLELSEEDSESVFLELTK